MFSLAFAAVAEQAASWSFDANGNTITDGEWTFTVSRRVAESEVAEGTLGLWVLNCTQAPSSLSTLDFGKPVDEYDSSKYAFTNLGSYGSWLSSDQKLMVERVVLPTGVPFRIDQAFTGCTNLKDITPFLSDSCSDICRGAFQNCSAITNALVVKGLGSSIADTWECFEGCSSVPSADLSQSTITALSRHFFYGCSSLEVVKLPATLDHLSSSSSVDVFGGVSSLRRMEMHSSVDGFLNLFPAAATALSEIHFYNCLPNETNSVLKNISTSQQVTTYLHDMTDAQLVEWAKLTQGGELTGTSTWKSSIAGAKAYVNRPLVVYSVQHAQIAAGSNAVVLDGQNGTFTVSRGDGDPLVGDLVVNYEVSGDAEAGTHYTSLPGSVTISNGQSSATISVSGLYINESYNKSLTLTLSAGEYEIIEGKSNATISVIGGCRHVGIERVQDASVLAEQNGEFVVSRGEGESCVGDLVVNYSVDGSTAVAGTDYVALAGSVTISNGESSATISVTGIYTGDTSSKSLQVSLSASDEYKIIEERSDATISITSGRRSVSVTKIKDANKELGQVGCFRVSRGDGDSTTGDLAVTLSYSGTATNGTTYREVPTDVTIPAGKSYVDFEVFPLNDEDVTDDSVAVITIATGFYTPIGEPATVAIVYGNGDWGCWRIFDDDGQKKITDGTWEFKVSLHGILVSTGDAYRMDVMDVTKWPNVVSPLDFTKGFDNVYGTTTYKIVNWKTVFGSDTGKVSTPTEAGDMIGKLALSVGAHDATITDYAFSGCTNMVFDLATMPTNITSIGSYAFSGSAAAGNLTAPNLQTIKSGAFRRCTGITSLFSPKVTAIGDNAFDGATGLVEVDFGPDSDCVLASIGHYAFQNCTALESFTPFLPSSLDVLNTRSPFSGCANLTNALVFSGSKFCETKDWNCVQMFLGCSKIPSADLSGSTITALRREAFGQCTSLEWVKLPSTIKEFGCPDDTSDSKYFNRDPFGGDMSVKLYISSTNLPSFNIKIPEVTSIEFSTNLTTIADSAFASTGYSGLTELKFTGAKPATIGENLFTGRKANAITAYVPYEHLDSWKTVADDQIITSKAGTWTSDTTQNISYYGKPNGLMLFLR